jgi:hypothetical protein
MLGSMVLRSEFALVPPARQASALLPLTAGANAIPLASWTGSNPCAGWRGVTCDEV